MILAEDVEQLTVVNLSTKAHLSELLGVSQTTYNNYVKGSPIPSDKLELMAKLFGCRVDYLLGRDTHRTA